MTTRTPSYIRHATPVTHEEGNVTTQYDEDPVPPEVTRDVQARTIKQGLFRERRHRGIFTNRAEEKCNSTHRCTLPKSWSLA